MVKKILYLSLPILIMLVIFSFSHQPYQEQDIKPSMNEYLPLEHIEPLVEPIDFTYMNKPVNVETHGVDGVVEFLIRKSAHFGIFFALMAATVLALHKVFEFKFSKVLLLSLVITVGYAALDEFHQSFTPNRTPYVGDVVLDSMGAVTAGFMIYTVFFWKRRK
ncbi:VanZ family protein [Halobacillus yeomjeoni]|nr:VanZ family protein [Halobacillus yeomjeoni]